MFLQGIYLGFVFGLFAALALFLMFFKPPPVIKKIEPKIVSFHEGSVVVTRTLIGKEKEEIMVEFYSGGLFHFHFQNSEKADYPISVPDGFFVTVNIGKVPPSRRLIHPSLPKQLSLTISYLGQLETKDI
jgi:hypothetical protein